MSVNNIAQDFNEMGTKMIWGVEVIRTKEYISPVEMPVDSFGRKILRASSVALIVVVVAKVLLTSSIVSIFLAITFSATWYAGELSLRAAGKQTFPGGTRHTSQTVSSIANRNQTQEGQSKIFDMDFVTLLGHMIKRLAYGTLEQQEAYKEQIQAQRQQTQVREQSPF